MQAATAATVRESFTCHLLPATVFEENRSGVREIHPTRHHLIVRCGDGHSHYRIYGADGKLQKPAEAFPKLGISGTELAQKMRELNVAALRLVPGETAQWEMSLDDFLVSAGYGIERLDEFLRAVRKLTRQTHKVTATQLAGIEQPIFSVAGELQCAPGSGAIVFEHQGGMLVYHTEDEKGMALPAASWTTQMIPARHAEAGSALLPGLEPHSAARELPCTIVLQNGELRIYDREQGHLLFSDRAISWIHDPTDVGSLLYLSDVGGKHMLRELRLEEVRPEGSNVRQLELVYPGKLSGLAADPHGNYVALLGEHDLRELCVFHRHTGRSEARLPRAAAAPTFDRAGNILFIDCEGQLRMAQSNALVFPPLRRGVPSRKRLENVDRALAVIRHERRLEQPADTCDAPEQSVERRLSAELEARFAQRIATCTSAPKLSQIQREIEELQNHPVLQGMPEVFDAVTKRVQERHQIMQVIRFEEAASAAEKAVTAAATLDELLDALAQVRNTRHVRRELAIIDRNLRATVEGRIKGVDQCVKQRLEQLRTAHDRAIEEGTRAVSELLGGAATIEELEAVRSGEACRRLDLLTRLHPDPQRRERCTEILNQTAAQRLEIIREGGGRERAAALIELSLSLQDTDELIARVSARVAAAPAAEQLDTLVTADQDYRRVLRMLDQLPPAFGAVRRQTFDRLLERKREELLRRTISGFEPSQGLVAFDGQYFPYFEPLHEQLAVRVQPQFRGAAEGRLVFSNSRGAEYSPEGVLVATGLSGSAIQQAVTAHEAEAHNALCRIERRVPPFDSRWSFNDFSRRLLSSVAKQFHRQLDAGQRILILEGEAGAGKNLLLDMFACLTNRELHTFACNYQTEKEDLTYLFKFDPKRGTYQVDSRFIEMVQTPGALVNLDELNTLPPGLLKMLNALFDYRRTLLLPDGREIKADPSVIFAGTMNPQYYIGVKPLSQEVKSRSRILFVNYPPESDALGRPASYEADIMARNSQMFAGLASEDFDRMWQFVINNDTANGADNLLHPEAVKLIRGYREIVGIANRLRTAHEKFRAGESSHPMEFVFSLRESADVAAELEGEIAQTADEDGAKAAARQMIKEVVLPKVGDPAERKRVEAVVDNH